MREIKFRFWDKRLKKMVYRHPLNYDFAHPEITPLQYTGLKDKGGKDIYEEDILRTPSGAAQSVIWVDGSGFMTEYSVGGQNKRTRYGIVPAMKEVVGNIYENPELLQQ